MSWQAIVKIKNKHTASGLRKLRTSLVLDNTMGSGSTGIACVNTNRNFIGMELDKEYFKIAEQKIIGGELNED